jgi:hypothetical protein
MTNTIIYACLPLTTYSTKIVVGREGETKIVAVEK